MNRRADLVLESFKTGKDGGMNFHYAWMKLRSRIHWRQRYRSKPRH